MLCFDLTEFSKEGFAIVPSFLPATKVAELVLLLEASLAPAQRKGGVRDVMDAVPALRAVASHKNVRFVVDAVLGPEAFVVRATLFDKTDAANWKVPWHQDLTIAVRGRRDTEGFGPWSTKAGVQHVQPPTAVLQRMLTVRIHLDPCPASNGALRVMSGSHHFGRLDQNHVASFIDEKLAVTCEANAGDALVMRPLLLHASAQSATPAHRRVLHFDFAAGNLAGGLTWRLP